MSDSPPAASPPGASGADPSAAGPGGPPPAAAPAQPGAGPGAAPAPAPGVVPPAAGRGVPAAGPDYASAQVGGGLSQQNRELNSALADFRGNDVAGDVVIGDKYELSFGQGRARIRVRRITPEELTEPFARTPALERLRAGVSGEPIVVLRGPRGYGKSAALVRTLGRDLRDGALMYYLDPATDLASFSCAEVPEHSVLILQDLPDSAADRLDQFAVERIVDELSARSCRLGITAGQAATLATISGGFLVLELTSRASPRQVFDRHLSVLLLGTGLTRDTMLSWPEVSALLDDQLGPDCSLADAARLAAMFFDARQEPQTAAERVRAQMTEYADEKVAQWFRKLDTLRAQCMAISLAVLNGLSRETVAQQARLLENRILPSPDAANAPAVTNPFAPDAAASPALLQARVASETRMTAHGPITLRTMRYLEQGFPGQVLRYVWRERDAARPALVSWLRQLGKSRDLAVRVRAATAAGVLACEAMDYVYDEIIYGWACDDREDARTSAAIALGPPASDPLTRDTVRSVVADWAKESSSWTLRAAAARTYGASIGLTSPSLALRELARLAKTDDLALMVAISNSYCELVVDGTTPLSVRVLGEVEKLAGDRAREKQVVGRLTLLGLSSMRGAPSGLSDPAGRLRTWPMLLVLSSGNARLAAAAAGLWRLSLNDPDVGSLVTASLDEWALAAEDVGELRTALVDLMHEVAAADGRARLAVLRRAQQWSSRDGQAPKTGQAVAEDLG
jgi:hypothetical protein